MFKSGKCEYKVILLGTTFPLQKKGGILTVTETASVFQKLERRTVIEKGRELACVSTICLEKIRVDWSTIRKQEKKSDISAV